jgi:transposase InsO family protein
VCDNAAAESFFAALKQDVPPGDLHARVTVADYIEVFYNGQRLHSALGYGTPAEALTDHQHRTAAQQRLRNCPRSLTQTRPQRPAEPD